MGVFQLSSCVPFCPREPAHQAGLHRAWAGWRLVAAGAHRGPCRAHVGPLGRRRPSTGWRCPPGAARLIGQRGACRGTGDRGYRVPSELEQAAISRCGAAGGHPSSRCGRHAAARPLFSKHRAGAVFRRLSGGPELWSGDAVRVRCRVCRTNGCTTACELRFSHSGATDDPYISRAWPARRRLGRARARCGNSVCDACMAELWWSVFGQGDPIWMVLQDTDGSLRAGAFLSKRRGGFAAAANIHSGDWNGLARDEEARAELWAAIAQTGANRIHLRALPTQAQGTRSACEALEQAGYRLVCVPGPRCPWLALPRYLGGSARVPEQRNACTGETASAQARA